MQGTRKTEEGQSTVEFVLVMMFLMGFLLFFVQLALIMAWGNYVHYATFMAARAYLSSGPSEDDQRERAKDVILRTVRKVATSQDRFPSIAKGFSSGSDGGDAVKGMEIVRLGDEVGDTNLSWRQGVRYTFKGKLFALPGSGGRGAKPNELVLTSESWLGREPSEAECSQVMSSKRGLIDNGC